MILSVCIPTNFRGEHLKDTLNSILLQLDEYEDVEIVVCDNSSDGKAFSYVSSLDNVQIKYVRSVAKGFQNSRHCLSIATGQYLKLHNDTMIFKSGTLKYLRNLCFYMEEQNVDIALLSNKNKKTSVPKHFENRDDLIDQSGLLATWSNAYLVSKDHFASVVLFDNYFPQLSILLNGQRNVRGLINNKNLFQLQFVSSKGGYNIFEVFTYNLENTFRSSSHAKEIPSRTTEELVNDFFPTVIFKNIYTRIENFEVRDWSKILIRQYGLLIFIKINILAILYPIRYFMRRFND